MKDPKSQKSPLQSAILRDAYFIWKRIPKYLRISGTGIGIFFGAATITNTFWVSPVRMVYIKAENLMDIIRENDDLIYWLCTAQEAITRDEKLKPIYKPLLLEYQNDRKKQLMELIPVIVEMKRIGTYAAFNAADKIVEFGKWNWLQYQYIALTDSCPPLSSLKDDVELKEWENSILKLMPYNISDFFWFYFEGFWKWNKDNKSSPQENKT